MPQAIVHPSTIENSAAGCEWYAVHCKPLKEWQAAAALEASLAVQAYVPEVKRRFRGKTQWAPLFPRYLFVEANLQEVPLSRINSVPNVLRLVTFGEAPQPVPAAIIDGIRQQVEALSTTGGLPVHGFQPGQAVRLKEGPLQGLEAIFVGPMTPSERVRVLLEFLGHLREVEVGVDALERTNPEPAAKQERRTRGRGRRIKRT